MNIQNAFDGKTAKVGDRVWSIQLGDAEIVQIDDPNTDEFPITIKTKDGHMDYYAMDGREDEYDFCPSLFYGPPDIIGPPKPKRMVKKTAALKVAVNTKSGSVTPICQHNFIVSPDQIVMVDLTGEYEVEE
jgi:hypothetical protein